MHRRWIWLLWIALFLLTGCDLEREQSVSTQFSLMSYNIHHGVNLRGGYDLEGVRETIELTGADIVALQEVDQNWGGRSQNTYQLDWLAQKLGLHASFAGALSSSTGAYGVGILSKYPIISTKTHILPGKLEQRVLLIAEIQLDAKMVYIFTTHLGLSEEDRAVQIQAILEIAAKYKEEPVILLGDFNTSQVSELAPLLKYFKGEETNLPLKIEETLISQRVKIDYIFTTHSVAILKAVSLLSPSSDHYPVSANVGIVWEGGK